MEYYGKQINRLIEELGKLPGIGPKTAGRLAFHILSLTHERVDELANAIKEAKRDIGFCKQCYNLTDSELCPICSNKGRKQTMIMVVENVRDLSAYEKTGKYEGVYHVLHGVVNPMLGIGAEEIKLKELMIRLQKEEIEEVIIATGSSLEGETTAMYLSKLIKPTGIKVTRIASGVPVGGELENVDEITLLRAFEGRTVL